MANQRDKKEENKNEGVERQDSGSQSAETASPHDAASNAIALPGDFAQRFLGALARVNAMTPEDFASMAEATDRFWRSLAMVPPVSPLSPEATDEECMRVIMSDPVLRSMWAGDLEEAERALAEEWKARARVSPVSSPASSENPEDDSERRPDRMSR